MIISLYDLQVTACPLSAIATFVEQHHYSHAVKGLTPTFCFRVDAKGLLVGAAIFGHPGMKRTIDKYSEGGQLNLVELRRFIMLDEAPRNSESKVLGMMLKELKESGVQRVLCYSDPIHGHVGTIYKAVGFDYLGRTNPTIDARHQDRQWSTRSLNRYKNYQDKKRHEIEMPRDAAGD